MRKQEQRVGLRLGKYLRDALEREADEQGVTLSEHIRRLLLVTHPHIPALERVAQIRQIGRHASVTSDEYTPYVRSQLQQLQEALVALDSFEGLVGQWRARATEELESGIAMLQEALRLHAGLDEITTTMKKGLERGGDVHAVSRERRQHRVD